MSVVFRAVCVISVVCFVSTRASSEVMRATWYGLHDGSGKHTADGSQFSAYDPNMCAHKTLPFGTRLRLRNIRNGAVHECTVHDRGPYRKGYQLDLSYAAAQRLGFGGIATLEVERVHR